MADLVAAPRAAVSNDIPRDVMVQVLADRQKPIKWFPGVGDALKQGANDLWQSVSHPLQSINDYGRKLVTNEGITNPLPFYPYGADAFRPLLEEKKDPSGIQGMFNTPSQQLQQMATGK